MQQIAEVMLRASVEKWSDDEPEADVMFEVIRKSPGVFESYLRNARAVVPLVEAQVAPLRDEVSRAEHHRTAPFPRDHVERKWGPLVKVGPFAADTAPESGEGR